MQAENRNVLLLVGDQWRADSLGCMGHPLVKTPVLDRLAGEGVLFRNHFAQASPCGPSRSCTLTGTYLMTNRAVANGTPLDAGLTNIALEVRKGRVIPYLYGYSDTAADPRGRPPGDPELHGYEGVLPGLEVGCRIDEALRPWRAHLEAKGYGDLPADSEALFESADGSLGGPAFYREEDSLTAFLADRIIDCIRGNRDRGWLIYATIWHPHPPLRLPAPWHEMYRPQDTPAAEPGPGMSDRDLHPFHRLTLDHAPDPGHWLGSGAAGRTLDRELVAQIRASYYAHISETDRHIGRILAALEESGQAEDTLVVSTVDHGEMLGDHGLLGKGSFLDSCCHIPLILRDPRAKGQGGRVVDRFTEAVDLMPTILDWLGLERPDQCDGQSLLPFVRGEEPARWRQFASFEMDFRDVVHGRHEALIGLDSHDCNFAVIREERFKYVHFAGLPPLLFDLQADPHETRNLAEHPSYRDRRLAMAEALLAHRQRHAKQSLTDMLVTYDGLRRRGGVEVSPGRL